jgi:hypothetical protein
VLRDDSAGWKIRHKDIQTLHAPDSPFALPCERDLTFYQDMRFDDARGAVLFKTQKSLGKI